MHQSSEWGMQLFKGSFSTLKDRLLRIGAERRAMGEDAPENRQVYEDLIHPLNEEQRIRRLLRLNTSAETWPAGTTALAEATSSATACSTAFPARCFII